VFLWDGAEYVATLGRTASCRLDPVRFASVNRSAIVNTENIVRGADLSWRI
jgi:hypothetical protein